ncbi:hypothetical protein CV945_12800 [Geobacillus sp. Manikaran-105]|nr:hypothetical protein IB49_18000 [Geobacillus sp. LC300]ASS85836.1 hypothetical protein GLN3_01040 [Geobacillus lituanicus]KZM52894.1 hypothetical protein A3Q36_11690 [Geobacillus stearothermophilus]PJW13653.1 hypothetical protein CV945_12800 [Geobacillus sp. Manikaran-105]PJW16747.1 hypothetical protein CV944_12640 [Geobacillus sp. WSUCF-018B]
MNSKNSLKKCMINDLIEVAAPSLRREPFALPKRQMRFIFLNYEKETLFPIAKQRRGNDALVDMAG